MTRMDCGIVGIGLAAALNVAELRFYGLLSRWLRRGACHFYVVIGGLIMRDASVDGFGDLLAVGCALQVVLVGGATDE